MFSTINNILNTIDDVVWGIPTIALILVTGIVVTVSTRGIQFTKLGRAFKSIFKENEGHGELSGFAALCTALSATIGTGNIVGVSTAVLAGGPGALFWMWLAAILGTATKYSECMLAIKYREVAADGHVLGGPFYTIEKGMGPKWKWLAVLFAIFGTLVGLFGIGTFTQINGICGAIQNAFDPQNANIAFYIGEHAYSWATVIGGAVITISAALVIIGGLKRIAKVAEKVVPAMAFIYIFLGLAVIIMNA
ncbi:MAG: sodium:alanine symporter family protein, partial [Treponema sp.]|nr:sodium:alanine symporter family protein [Treponema sp.]